MDVTFIDRAFGGGIPYITYAIPVFFLLIGLEALGSILAGRPYYRLNDSISDLACGIVEQTIGIFLKTALFAGYLACYAFVTGRGWNLVDVDGYSPAGKWAAAILLIVGVDLAYYWFHRVSHERNAPWAGHVVHHSSEEYNLTVALRQGALQSVFSWVFYLPLALLGFPPLWFLAASAFDTLYQFWIHTRTIGRLGPLEWVFNTPSHHRVHHARNPRYLDRNYPGVFIVWDRWFGTFQAEDEEPIYGLTKPLESWNPLWANLHVWRDLWRDARQAAAWGDAARVWVAPQGWRPRNLPPAPAPPADPGREERYDARAPLSISLYVSAHFLVTLLAAVVLLAEAPGIEDRVVLAGSVAIILWSLTNVAGLIEGRAWAGASEAARLAVLAVVLAAAGPGVAGAGPVPALGLAGVLASAGWLFAERRQVFRRG